MNTFNNFSPLAFREKSQKATYKKWYAYGKEFALPFSTTELPPFQFTVVNLPSFEPNTVEVFLVNEATGTRGATGIYPKVDTMDEHNAVLYVSPGSNVYAKSIEPGVYRAEFTIPGGETYVSTPICVTEGIETNTNFVKLEYWNDEKLAYPNGFVTTGTNNDFKFQMYIPATFFKPKYEFEEEITKRAGYKFLELQTCNKVFGFNFLAPEYICDALRLVRLSDYIRFTHDGEYYNALNFEYNPDWQDNGYLAAIECQFETDTIIQKLPSFNRRDRESFYNALLADIETPILFSPDVVGLYYREYKQGEPTIKGKLIRELSPIDLIDENTTIAVDMGAGEARKFNLFKMLEGYISKNHDDVTEFLLSLRGGVNVGTPNTSGEYPASVDRDGNAKLQNIQAGNVDGKKSHFSSVETGFLSVNNTAAAIDSRGNANVEDLIARGSSLLRGDVYTGLKNGNRTGKITKDGQLQYLSAIIYEFLSSETFVPGFLGEGFKIWVENGNWHIECDNLTVRQTMNIFELLIQKIRSVNGAIVVSQSNGKVTVVEDTGTQYKITFGEEFPTFQEGDLIRCQSWSKNNLKFYWVEVKTAADGYVLCDKSEFNNVVPAVGDEVVQMGNTKNAERQALIYITAQESGKPYIEILNGVKTKSLTGTDRTRLGDLSNIVDPDFTGEAAVKGTGFYSTNAFLKGIFVLRNGKRVEDEIKIAKDAADQAAQDAANAAQSAQEAKDRLNKWADDGFISPTEKPALIDEGKRIQAEYLQIKANAGKYGVPIPQYTEAYNNYLNELRYHSAATPEDIAVRPELAQSQTIYYDRRNGALNAIADAAKSYVDEADKKLKEYLDTEITAIPGKIELAVRSLRIADTNLLFDSNHILDANPYQMGAYKYDRGLIVGKTYNLTVCYKCADSDVIRAYNNPSFGWIGSLPKSEEETVYSQQITPVNPDGSYFYFYKFPQQETTNTYIKWAVITEGSIGVANWIPSASERKVGIRNLFPISRMKTVTNQNFNYFDVTGWVATIYEQDELKARFKPSTTYTITGKYTILGKPTAGTGYKDSSVAFCMWNNTNLIDLWRKNVENEAVGTTGGISNTFTTPSNLDGYRIIVYTMYDSGNWGEFRFTDLMVAEGINEVGWSQAPEDAFTDSKKYTDTQIKVIDGKIELSVKTQLETATVGGGNVLDGSKDYWFNESNYTSNVELKKEGSNGVIRVKGKGGFDCFKRFLPVNKSMITNGKSYTVGIDVNVQGNYYHTSSLFLDITSGFDFIAELELPIPNKASWIRYYITVDLPNGGNVNDWDWLFGFKGVNNTTNPGLTIFYKNINLTEGGIGTSWSPSQNDTYNKSVEYTVSQIDILDKKIELKVSSTVYEEGLSSAKRIARYISTGKMLEEHSDVCFAKGINNLKVYNNSGGGAVTLRVSNFSGIPNNTQKAMIVNTNTALGNTLPGAGGFYFGNSARYAARFLYKIVALIPSGKHIAFASNATGTGGKSEWLTANLGTGKYEEYYYLVTCGDSGALSSTGFFYILESGNVEWYVAYATVYDVYGDNSQINRTTYETKITQLDQSISLKASQSDLNATTERVRQAEIKIEADRLQLNVVEGKADGAQSTANSANTAAGNAQNTANSANSLAGTANSKADATNNGLVVTGINITSRKIVLKSDNVLFQNNAGQQTAALNANGRLTANVIEAGEVVANGFAAQRITTGNLTVTDGAVIAGMTISGGVLRGSAIEIQNGAKIGNFTISNGIFSANGVAAGMQMRLGSNLMEIDSSGLRIEQKSGGYAMNTSGNGRHYLRGSDMSMEFPTYSFERATSWKAPGVFYAATILSNGRIGATWGNPSFNITSVEKLGTGRYRINYTGYNGNVFPMLTPLDASKWTSAVLETAGGSNFTYKMWDVGRILTDCGVVIYFCGMV